VTSYTIRGSNPGRGKRFFSFQSRPDWLWSPFSLLISGYRIYFTDMNGRGMKLSAQHPALRLWMSSTENQSPCRPSWHELGQIYLYLYKVKRRPQFLEKPRIVYDRQRRS